MAAPAYANEPPVFLSPTESQARDGITTTEGNPVVIPFIIQEPDNDAVEYVVEHLIGGVAQPSLPAGAVLETDPKTAERRLVWWPSLSQEGLYTFRFTAVDDKGLSAEKTVRVTVQNRTGNPAIVNARAASPMTLERPETVGSLYPGKTITISEGQTFAMAFNLADPEGDTVTVAVDGLLGAVVGRSSSEWLEWRTRTDHSQLGIHTATLTATDAQGNQSTLSFAVDVRRVFNGQGEAIEIRPDVKSGLVRDAGLTINSVTQTAIVRGEVTLGVTLYDSWNEGISPLPFPVGMRYHFVLHTADAQGIDVKTYLSGVLTGPQTITWNSASIPDGTYVVDIQIVEPDPADTLKTALERFYRRPLYVIPDNTAGPVTGPQWLPSVGSVGMRSRWTEATAVDWFFFSGNREFPAAEPWPYEPIAPPQTDAERQLLLQNDLTNGGTWFPETWNQVFNARFDKEPIVSRTQEGHISLRIVPFSTMGNNSLYSWRFPLTDGPRNQGSFGRETGLRPDPTGPGFVGISWEESRMVRVGPDGTVTTLAGYVTRRDVVPYSPFDTTITRQEYIANQWQLVGQFEGGVTFNLPRDLVFDPADPTKAYIADTGNQRIALVDLSGPQAVITTFSGKAGTAGYAEGSRLDARFNEPASVEIVGRTLYVADTNNLRIRAINLDTGIVTTAVGSGPNAPTIPTSDEVSRNQDQYTWASVPFNQAAIVYPGWIRRSSNGDLVVKEANRGTGNIRRVRFSEQVVEQIVDNDTGNYSIDVDWRGNVGPVDSILLAGTVSNHMLGRILPNGTVTFATGDGSVPYSTSIGMTGAGDPGTYPISVVIDDESPRFAYTGQNQVGLTVFRPLQSDDPVTIDLALSSHGRDLYQLGTILKFFGSGPGGVADDRSSLAALHGRKGHNWLGTATFDELAKKTDAELAAYIQAGMAGNIARPEITGRDLRARSPGSHLLHPGLLHPGQERSH